jgi:hypothetical protein
MKTSVIMVLSPMPARASRTTMFWKWLPHCPRSRAPMQRGSLEDAGVPRPVATLPIPPFEVILLGRSDRHHFAQWRTPCAPF